MRYNCNLTRVFTIACCATSIASTADAFEGQITAELVRGTETTALLYTVGPEHLRIEVTGSIWPHPVNIVELKSGALGESFRRCIAAAGCL